MAQTTMEFPVIISCNSPSPSATDVAVFERKQPLQYWLVHPRPQSVEIFADCRDFGSPHDNTPYTLDTRSDDLKKFHMAQKTCFEHSAKYEPYIAAFDYPDV